MLAFARGVGEFGATIVFAGNVRGETQTLTLAIYEQLDANFDVALSIGILLVVLSALGAALLQTALLVETLELDIAVALRSYELDVRLSVGAETLALVGPSGAGKSTVLRAIAGLLAPDRGRIALGERRLVRRRRGGSTAPPEARSVGLVFQEYALFPHMTVRRNVAFGGGAARVDELLERLGIAHLADERPGRAVGRRAPARRAGPRARPRPRRAAARRAALGARRAHARERPRAPPGPPRPARGCRRSSSPTTSATRRRWPTASA